MHTVCKKYCNIKRVKSSAIQIINRFKVVYSLVLIVVLTIDYSSNRLSIHCLHRYIDVSNVLIIYETIVNSEHNDYTNE